MRLPVLVTFLALIGANEALAQNPFDRTPRRQQRRTAQPATVAIRYRLWQPEIDGDVRTQEAGVVGQKLDLASDINMDEKEIFHDITIWGKLSQLGNHQDARNRTGALSAAVREDAHPERQGAPRDLLADSAEANDSQGLAVQSAEVETVPALRRLVDPRFGQLLLGGEHRGQHPLCDRDRAGSA